MKEGKKRLEELLNNKNLQSEKSTIIDVETIDELPEEDREQIEKDWETITISANREELKKEIDKIKLLIEKAKLISNKESEVKLSKFKELLKSLQDNITKEEKIKILVFTESKDTLEYLEGKIKRWGYSTITIHGGMNMEERVAAESIFKNEVDVLIATEAAGEGINLQFCNLMINYDIPWNPNRLEQRMGRIHRYGQTREVYAYNLVNIDTREGKVLNKLFEKIEEIKKALGNDKVFDVLGEVIDSRKFTEAIINAAVNAKTVEEILNEIDFKVDEEYIQKIKENLGETLATHFIDYTFIKEMALKAKENRLIPEYTQNYFIKAFEKAGGKIERNNDNTYQIKSIPFEIRKISEGENFKKVFGTILKSYPSITFDKEKYRKNSKIEFVSFGHPLFEAVMQWVESTTIQTLQKGSVFYDPDGKLDGYLLFYEGEITDGKDKTAGKRIFSFFYSLKSNEVKPFPPSVIWDLKEGDNSNLNINFHEIENIKNSAENIAMEVLERYKNEIFEERKRQAEIKQKYGVSSLQYIICRLDRDLVELQYRKEKGELVDLSIHNKEEQKKNYEKNLEDLKNTIQKEQSLSMSSPKFIGMLRVIPFTDSKNQLMSSDEEIEAIGMRLAMEYEVKEGRTPQDVSSQNLGYDIRSVANDGKVRYIEVKARALEGDIALTQNEWFKAQRFGDDYYLYVVFNAANNPQLYIISNPAKNLNPEQKVELVRFFVKREEIINKKEK